MAEEVRSRHQTRSNTNRSRKMNAKQAAAIPIAARSYISAFRSARRADPRVSPPA